MMGDMPTPSHLDHVCTAPYNSYHNMLVINNEVGPIHCKLQVQRIQILKSVRLRTARRARGRSWPSISLT